MKNYISRYINNCMIILMGSLANYFIVICDYGPLCRTDTFKLLSDEALVTKQRVLLINFTYTKSIQWGSTSTVRSTYTFLPEATSSSLRVVAPISLTTDPLAPMIMPLYRS